MAEHAVDLVVDDGVARDLRQVRADERERMRAVHSLDLVEPVDGLLARDVATQSVDRVRRIADDLAGQQRLDGAPDLPGLGMLGVDLDEHDDGNVTRRHCEFATDAARMLRSRPRNAE